ncbi:MAG: hypothetical protein UV73_C0001G0062 [Candidatus Gottesmanbacteria bacterium GW2011_GWA2_43_14]|uniref:Bacterial Ig domain-containing protein n=1 Tax=Candidatus Gottesmanbacteria bacterium GW2011_GWA2_43_14 TaxID=1618443 RepID=A0A0G1FU62_9BACT|nr:MAG: hypothetical protein UV73_C0001G0062 [Candidatus Gottesmanbacteria bacterium GW2011_GWA2_43_14]
MQYTSHRLRSQEKKLFRKFIKTFILLIVGIIAAIQIGLPLMAKIVVAFSFLRKDQGTVEEKQDTMLFSPSINSLPEATNSARIIVSGATDKNSTVVLALNGEEEITESDNEGQFEVRGVGLVEGENKIEAYLQKDGKRSSAASVSIIYKKDPPEIIITEPENGRKFSGEDRIVTIKGNTETDARLSVNDRYIIVGREGNFEYEISLNDGNNDFKFKAVDIAGNSREVEFKLEYSP